MLAPGYELSFDATRLDLDVIHGFLTESYWSRGIPRPLVERALANSLCIGGYDPDRRQASFARLVTDHATFGYLADVFVLPEHRGRGLGLAMTEAFLARPEVRGMRRLLLATRDAHGVYERAGFEQVTDAKPFMQILRREIYRS